ncbi:MAG TPA: hypothetical protein ENG40_02595, partial [Thermoprotei archaeon]|nr:hypothetical protein [Thermoprotei archaeon]
MNVIIYNNINLVSQPLTIVLDKRFYYVLDVIHITIHGSPGKTISIEIRDPRNILVYWGRANITDQGYVVLNITVLEYWRYGRYTVYVSMIRGPRVMETFIVGGRIRSNIFLFASMNMTDTYNRNNFYIALNPPLNISVLLKASDIYGKKIFERNISLINGYGVFSLKFNKTGIHVLNVSWAGNEYFNGSYTIYKINVVDRKLDKYCLNNDILLSKNIVSMNESIDIYIQPKSD